MKKLSLANIGILAGAAAIGYLLYIYTKPANSNGYTVVNAGRNTDGGTYVKTFQDDSELINDFGMVRV